MKGKIIRTDLAVEAAVGYKAAKLKGVSMKTERLFGCKVTSVEISDNEAAKKLCKPVGIYSTLELDAYISRTENSFAACANALSTLLRRFEAISNGKSFLVACLGNKAITPDAIGPETANRLIVTRHLKHSLPSDFAEFSSVAVFRTGVLGTTGIESADALMAMCDRIKPDCVIAVDALASAEFPRLCRNIQICDSGISPGSGVGNDRKALNRDTLGVPVIALGVPTVIDAACLSDNEALSGSFVTPRNIDELVSSTAKLIAYGINLALHTGLTVEDVDLLVA